MSVPASAGAPAGPTPRPGTAPWPWRLTAHDAAYLLVILLASSWWLSTLPAQRLHLFDTSGFLDAGYRLFRGQRIYQDFYYNAGPIQPAMHALAFALLGFTGQAVIAHLLVVNALVLLAVYLIARRDLPPSLAAIPTLLTGVWYYGHFGTPWYDQNAACWVVLAVLVLEAGVPFRNARAAQVSGLLMGLLAVLALLTKTNLGGAAGLTLGAALLVSPHARDSLLGYVAGCALAGITCLLLVDGTEMIYQTLLAYAPGERLADTARLRTVLAEPPALLLSLALGLCLLAGAWRGLLAERRLLVLLLGLFLTERLAGWTGSMDPRWTTPLATLQLVLLARLLYRHWSAARPAAWRWAALLALLAIVAQLGWLSWTRLLRPWREFEKYNITHELRHPSFRGWKAYPDALGPGMDDALSVLAARVPPAATLLVLPSATMIYGMSGREPYAPAPFIFHEGILPYPGEKVTEFRQALFDRPPEWILLHDNLATPAATTTGLLRWLELSDWVAQSYHEAWAAKQWRLLRYTPRAP